MSSIEAIIERQCRRWEQQQQQHPDNRDASVAPLPIVTVSRQTGSRGSYFASRLAQKLGYQRLHREVIDAMCAMTGYRKRILESLDERARSDLEVMVEAMVSGQSVDNADYVRHLFRVVLTMSRLGGVVVIGRGANFILGPARGFHIRFICPMEKRVKNLVTYKELSEEEAMARVEESDEQRRDFVRKVFHANINDPHQYDLVVNAAYLDVEEIVATAVEAIQGKMNKLANLRRDQP